MRSARPSRAGLALCAQGQYSAFRLLGDLQTSQRLRLFPFSQGAQLRHDFLQSLCTPLLHGFSILIGNEGGRSQPVC